MSPSTVTRTETGERLCTEAYFNDLADLLGLAGPEREVLERMAMEVWDADPPWWSRFADVLSANYAAVLEYEETATRRRDYQTVLIPAHLQTERYSWEVTSAKHSGLSQDYVEDLVAVRSIRQRRVHEEPQLEIDAVVAQSALMFDVGGPKAHREQLAHLLEVTLLPHVSLRVIPFGAGVGGTYPCPFQILSYADGQSDVAFGQGIGGSSFMNDDRDLRRLNRLFTNLAKPALSREDSRALIVAMEKDLT